jgi:hypothetical protein
VARALTEFLERQRKEEILRKLNEVYAEPLTTSEGRTLKAMRKTFQRIVRVAG